VPSVDCNDIKLTHVLGGVAESDAAAYCHTEEEEEILFCQTNNNKYTYSKP